MEEKIMNQENKTPQGFRVVDGKGNVNTEYLFVNDCNGNLLRQDSCTDELILCDSSYKVERQSPYLIDGKPCYECDEVEFESDYFGHKVIFIGIIAIHKNRWVIKIHTHAGTDVKGLLIWSIDDCVKDSSSKLTGKQVRE